MDFVTCGEIWCYTFDRVEKPKSWQVFEKWQTIDWILFTCLGVGIVILAASLSRSILESRELKVEYLSTKNERNDNIFWVNITGGVERPGVYKVKDGDRVKDLLVLAGGLSEKADRVAVDSLINMAAKLSDGEKLVIPLKNNTSPVVGYSEANNASKLININNSSVVTLDTLWGIGEATAQKIVENRPYKNIDELVSRKIVSKKTFEKIKSQISVY